MKEIREEIKKELDQMKKEGLIKKEREITSSQNMDISLKSKEEKVLNFCANNYLGLSNNKRVIKAAKKALDEYGYGLSSVRFICGTQSLHLELEKEISEFLGTEDTILFSSCYDANGAVFEPLLNDKDAIISDELNHASIIDGIRLSKAQRFRYKHSDMRELEEILIKTKDLRRRLIVTDGVFSMDGDMAKLDIITTLAKKYGALVLVDDSHATGYLGDSGKGTPEVFNVEVDLITTTFGKALGGASGGCISGKKYLIDLYRQKARPYLFSNTLAPAVAGGTREVLKIVKENPIGKKALSNAKYFRSKMEKAGFDLVKGNTAIVPVMLYDENLAVNMSSLLLDKGIYVIGFCYPVVAKSKARIRVQFSAKHKKSDVDKLVAAFIEAKNELLK